jgi:hypothetical protein
MPTNAMVEARIKYLGRNLRVMIRSDSENQCDFGSAHPHLLASLILYYSRQIASLGLLQCLFLTRKPSSLPL